MEDTRIYCNIGNVEMHKIMLRPHDDYVGKTILMGDYNEVVKAWYYDLPFEKSTEDSCVIHTTYGNNIKLKDGLEGKFSSDDLILATHCHDGYIRIWFTCDPRDIVNDYIKIGFETATAILDYSTYTNNIEIANNIEIFDIILPTHPDCWEKEYDEELKKCKCKFTIGHSRVVSDTELSYEYTSKVEDFIHCIVPMDGYILIETYDLPKDREYVRIEVTISV